MGEREYMDFMLLVEYASEREREAARKLRRLRRRLRRKHHR